MISNDHYLDRSVLATASCNSCTCFVCNSVVYVLYVVVYTFVDEMTLGKMTVHKMSLDLMTVGQVSLDGMTVGKIYLDKMT